VPTGSSAVPLKSLSAIGWRRSIRWAIEDPWAVYVLIVCIALLISGNTAACADYPSRPVKIVVPYPAGGTADVLPRIFADWLSRKWGQTVFIDNKPGAGGNIGAEIVANSDADGYTLLATAPGPLVISQYLYSRLGFDPSNFVPISIMAIVPNALIANARTIAANSVADLIAYARANPGKVTVATQGNGTTSHLTSEMFQMMANVKFVTVPYRGSAPALQGLLAGDVDIMFDNLGVSLALVKGGQLKILGVGTEERLASLPDVPAVAETLPGFSSLAWFAVVAPARTPQKIAEGIAADIGVALRDPDVQRRLAELSAKPMGSDPEATAKFMHEEADRWSKVIRAAGVKLD
jgi:tripartite-type tricarboxylate transporter receptor subunit TctC